MAGAEGNDDISVWGGKANSDVSSTVHQALMVHRWGDLIP